MHIDLRDIIIIMYGNNAPLREIIQDLKHTIDRLIKQDYMCF